MIVYQNNVLLRLLPLHIYHYYLKFKPLYVKFSQHFSTLFSLNCLLITPFKIIAILTYFNLLIRFMLPILMFLCFYSIFHSRYFFQ